MALRIQRGLARCEGGLELRNVRWQLGTGATPLTAERLPLTCRDRALVLPASAWRFGPWGGRLSARADADRRLALQLEAQPPPRHPLGRQPIKADLQGSWGEGLLRLTRLDGRLGGSSVRASGSLGRALALDARWRLDPDDVAAAARLPVWARQPLVGRLRVDGPLATPRLRLETGQASQRLLGPWQAALVWSDKLLRLERFDADRLAATARLPLSFQPGQGLVAGPLLARVEVRDYPLARLDPLLGTTLQGQLDARARSPVPWPSCAPTCSCACSSPAPVRCCCGKPGAAGCGTAPWI